MKLWRGIYSYNVRIPGRNEGGKRLIVLCAEQELVFEYV